MSDSNHMQAGMASRRESCVSAHHSPAAVTDTIIAHCSNKAQILSEIRVVGNKIKIFSKNSDFKYTFFIIWLNLVRSQNTEKL